MKHIYELENFLNQGSTQVNLYDVKSKIRVFGDTIKVKYTDNYPTGNSWKDDPQFAKYNKQMMGITFSVLGPDWIQCVIPSGPLLEKDRRLYLCLAIPGIFGKDPKEILKYHDELADTYRLYAGEKYLNFLPQEGTKYQDLYPHLSYPMFIVSVFGNPTDSMAKVNKEVPGLNEKPYYVPSEYIGKKTTWGLKTDLIVGNKLTIVIDATKAKYRNV